MKAPALLLGLLLLFSWGCSHHSISPLEQHSVELNIFQPFASEVFVHTSENHFLPQPLSRKFLFYWTATIIFEKQFSYFYTVDNTVVLPECDFRELDDFGNFNCIYPTNL
jgi:hypothetical protein